MYNMQEPHAHHTHIHTHMHVPTSKHTHSTKYLTDVKLHNICVCANLHSILDSQLYPWPQLYPQPTALSSTHSSILDPQIYPQPTAPSSTHSSIIDPQLHPRPTAPSLTHSSILSLTHSSILHPQLYPWPTTLSHTALSSIHISTPLIAIKLPNGSHCAPLVLTVPIDMFISTHWCPLVPIGAH